MTPSSKIRRRSATSVSTHANIAINSASAQLSFRNNFNLQDAFDGGVLEVSSPNIAGGAFTDITDPAVGGSFVTGGYTDIISTAFGNPIAGRMAWSGNSGGYINTVVNLGPNVNGQTIKLRFRLGTDQALAVAAGASTRSQSWAGPVLSLLAIAQPRSLVLFSSHARARARLHDSQRLLGQGVL